MSTVHLRWKAGSKRGEATLYPEDRASIDRTWRVHKLVHENPKSKASGERFDLYRDGMSVDDYVRAVVERGGTERLALEDILWDLNHDFIALRDPRNAWSVAEAKAKLSEILRLARSGAPQFIGTEDACVVVSASFFLQMAQADHLGRFLVESAPRGYEIDLPSRASHRGDPFAGDEEPRR